MSELRGNSLKFEAEFFRKSNNLTLSREKKIRSFQMRSAHILFLLLVTLLVGYGAYRSALFLFEGDMLQVRSFRLHQQPVFEKDRVRQILRQSAGNILTLDLRHLRAQLLQLPEIQNVAISRVLPDTVEIGFTLRRPLFYFKHRDRFQLLDAGGLLLGEQQTLPVGLIPVQGSDPAAPGQVAVFAGELLPMRERIEYVAYREPFGIELKLLDGSEVFFPGTTGFIKKINRYFKIKPHLALNGAAVRTVDLRIAGRIYFECFAEPQGDS
ncbi:MAG TPA: FtsQ-type POTRA domain-containing protein [Candidatus Binatia bacterium]|nr:FtsQ-type POTRA domain-containing protein [Candidatus Binatia bacterium]